MNNDKERNPFFQFLAEKAENFAVPQREESIRLPRKWIDSCPEIIRI
jgi:hypothetical protein